MTPKTNCPTETFFDLTIFLTYAEDNWIEKLMYMGCLNFLNGNDYRFEYWQGALNQMDPKKPG